MTTLVIRGRDTSEQVVQEYLVKNYDARKVVLLYQLDRWVLHLPRSMTDEEQEALRNFLKKEDLKQTEESKRHAAELQKKFEEGTWGFGLDKKDITQDEKMQLMGLSH